MDSDSYPKELSRVRITATVRYETMGVYNPFSAKHMVVFERSKK